MKFGFLVLLLLFACVMSSCTSTSTDGVANSSNSTEDTFMITGTQTVPKPDHSDMISADTVEPVYIDELNFKDVELQWIRMINQDVKAVAEKDVRAFASLRNLEPDPSLLPTTPYASVTFMDIFEHTKVSGLVQVDFRFLGALKEPQIATYTFEWKGEKWIITDVSINASYIPMQKEPIQPKYIDEASFSGDKLEWVKIINQDVKAIAEGDEAAFDALRQSDQSLPADIPSVPVGSIQFIEVVDQSKTKVRIRVDRRKWGREAEPNYMNYVLVLDHERWMIADVD